jgi:hypothetical protein
LLLAALGCGDRVVSLNGREEFAPLVGLCVQLKEPMFLLGPPGEHILREGPGPSDPVDQVPWLAVKEHARIVVDRLDEIIAFDGRYLFIFGRLEGSAESLHSVHVEEVFDVGWRREVVRALSEGRKPRMVEVSALPLRFDLVEPCRGSIL